jgi:hypothetical protein
MVKRRKSAAGGGRDPRADADLELPPGYGVPQAAEVPRFAAPVDVFITHYRHRLADPQGASTKAAMDAIVRGGLLADDSPKEIREIRDRQKKVPTCDPEKTEIEIRVCELGPPEGWP